MSVLSTDNGFGWGFHFKDKIVYNQKGFIDALVLGQVKDLTHEKVENIE